MDLAGWRRKMCWRNCWIFTGIMQEAFACDQDTINGALNGRILPLSPRYNFFTNYRYFRYNTLVQLCDAYRAVGKKSLLQLREDQRSFIFWEMSGPGSVATTIIMENGIGNIWLWPHGRTCLCKRVSSGICSFGGALTRWQGYVRLCGWPSANGWGWKLLTTGRNIRKSKILKNIKLKEKTVRERDYGRRHEYMCRNIKL